MIYKKIWPFFFKLIMGKRTRKNQKGNYKNEGMKTTKNISSTKKREKTSAIKSNYYLRKNEGRNSLNLASQSKNNITEKEMKIKEKKKNEKKK